MQKRQEAVTRSKEEMQQELERRKQALVHTKAELSDKMKKLLSGDIKAMNKWKKTRAAEILAVFAKHNFYAGGLTPVELRTTLEDLADQARMSPFHFSRQFKRYAGVSPHTYLVNARINTARFYLVSSDLTVKEIAYNCGFSSVSSFCTCFKKNVGSTPMDYRNAHLTASG